MDQNKNISADLTRQKKAVAHQALLASIINTSDDAIVSIDLEKIITSWNQGAATLFGYSSNEVLGKRIFMLIAPDRLKEESEIIRKVASGDYVKHYETEWIGKNGMILPISLNASPIRDSDGMIVGASKILRNISERKQAQKIKIELEEKVRTKAAELTCIFERITDGFIALDKNFCYTYVNSKLGEMVGRDPASLLGKCLWDEFPDAVGSATGDAFRKAMAMQLFMTNVDYYPPLDLWQENHIYPGQEGLSVFIRDISEQKKAERLINELNITLEHKVTERTEQLAIANSEMEAFTYSVSHDLRAPLRGIIGFTTILEEEYCSKLDDEAKRIAAVIKSSTLKMGQLIDDLLSFSRMGRQDMTKTGIDSRAMVEEVISELDPGSDGNTIKWELHELPWTNGDISVMRRVWINLISNAIKYSGRKELPHIEIGSFPNEGQTAFFVRDNGVGFDSRYKDKLFKVFQRLHDTDQFEGTGVGLALVTKIISKHGGKVWAEGEVDKGACFYFSLPAE